MNTVVLAFLSPGPMEMVIIGVIAVLLFGKRLPEVGRSLGRSLVEFKKGISGIESDIHSAVHSSPASSSGSRRASEAEDREEATAPKFEPPAAASGEDEPASSQPTTETADNGESVSGA